MSNIQASGTDLDSLFEPYNSGFSATKAATTNIQVNGTDLKDRYNAYFAGTKVATTNIQAGGTDLKDIFQKLNVTTAPSISATFGGIACICDSICQVFSGNRIITYTVNGWLTNAGNFPVRVNFCNQGGTSSQDFTITADAYDLGTYNACCDDAYYIEANTTGTTNPNYSTATRSDCFPAGLGASGCSCAGQVTGC